VSIKAILERKGRQVETIAASASVKDAADRMREKKIAALVVTDGAAIEGIVSERELVHALSQHGSALMSRKVRDVMTKNVVTVEPEDSIKHAMALMTRYRTRHLPVIRECGLAGIVSIGDLVKHRLDDLELETSVLRDAYIAAH
jgi:CBS domain-containing protein